MDECKPLPVGVQIMTMGLDEITTELRVSPYLQSFLFSLTSAVVVKSLPAIPQRCSY